MKNVIGLSILLTLSLCLGCYDDKGNYDYHDFNEVTIGNRGFDTAYLLTSYVDTLRISPELEFKLEENKHLTYEWVARSNAVGFVEYPISNDRNLVYPMSLSAGEYTLFFKVKDTLNTMEYSNATAFQVQDLLTKGWVILGENSNGEAQMDMITYSVDTMVLKNILQESGLPVLKDPVKVWVVDNYVDNMIHVSTGDGTYRLNRHFQFGHFRRRVVRYQVKVVRSAIQIEFARSHSTLYRIYFMIQRFRRRGRRTCGESIDTESLSIRHIRCRVGTGRSLVRLRPVKREAERYRISLLRAGFPGSLFRTSCQSRRSQQAKATPYPKFQSFIHRFLF